MLDGNKGYRKRVVPGKGGSRWLGNWREGVSTKI